MDQSSVVEEEKVSDREENNDSVNLSDLELGGANNEPKQFKWSKSEICFICQNPESDHSRTRDNLSSNNASDNEKLLRGKSDSDNIA